MSCIMCYLDLCIQLYFFPKDQVKSLSEQNIKMKPPVALKLCLFLKSQKTKSYQQLDVVWIRRKM